MPLRSSVAVLGAPTNAHAICHISQSLRTVDPRPDLVGNSATWTQLLVIAADVLGEADNLFGTLHGLRCCGCGLQTQQDDSWRIVRGEMDADEYQVDRERWLMPRRREVDELLRRLQIGGV